MKRASRAGWVLWCVMGAAAFAPGAAPADTPAAAAATPSRLEFFGLLPDRSTRTDVELLLGDAAGGEGGRVLYVPPDQAKDAERIEAVYQQGTRQVLLLEVVLRQPAPYADIAGTVGQRVLTDRTEGGWVWEYRTPTYLALGYTASVGGTPQWVERLRYVSPRYLADLFIARGEKAEKENRTDEAVTEYEKGSRIDPTYAAPHLHMGKLHEKIGAKDKALLYFTAATKADYPVSGRAEGHYLVGRLHHKEMPDAALKAYSQAVAEDPSHAQAHFYLGRVYQGQRKPKEAVAAFEKTIKLKPGATWLFPAYYNIGAIQEEQGNAKAAAAAFRRAVEIDASGTQEVGSTKAAHRLVSSLLRANELAEAEKESRRQLERDKDDAHAMVYLAMALSSRAPERSALVSLLSKDGQLKESLEWLDKAIAAGYRDTATLESSLYLKPLREQSSRSFNRLLSRIR